MSATDVQQINIPDNTPKLSTMESAGERGITQLLRASFAALDANPGVESRGRVVGRAELWEQSDRLASWLVANGAGVGSLVGIYMDRSVEMLVSVLAVLKAGAAYVPLDPMFPRMRLDQILQETKPPVVLTMTAQSADVGGLNTRLLCVDGEKQTWASVPVIKLPEITSEMRAYVIFTSGSTGVPKGVEVTHASVVNLLRSAAELVQVNSNDRLFAVTTLAFDISVLELLLPLVTGGTVLLAGKEALGNGKLLAEELASTQATILQATPITFRLLLEAGYKAPAGFKMLCGGEAWNMALAERMLSAGARVWNMYGPTETTVWSSITEVKHGEAKLTIGPPIARTWFYVVNEKDAQAAAGDIGELLIGGAGVARGYLNRDALTAERFVPDRMVEGERMYRTGDEVRLLADGRLEFIGRTDQQVKLRGYRIELGEIEAAMLTCEGIREAVVVMRSEDGGEPYLTGFYTAEHATAPSMLRECLAARLPAYMVPRSFEWTDAFPLTPNGKTDRRALANVPLAVPAGDEGSAGTPLEQEIAAMWEKLFPGAAIGADSDFFDLGGDSLLLVLLQSMIHERFALRLNATDITSHSTVNKLSQWVVERRSSAEAGQANYPDPRLLPLQTEGDGPPIFILPQLMVFRSLAEELGSEQPVYGMQMMDEDVPAEVDSMDMPSLARMYINLIRKVQPKGPYRVAGWCMWGLMAYEVARVLEEQGEVVEIVVIIDAVAPGYWDRYTPLRQLAMVGVTFAHRLGWFAKRLWRSSLAKTGEDEQRRRRTLYLSIAAALPKRFRPQQVVVERTRLERLVTEATVTYRPSPLQANVVLFKSQVRPTGRFMGRDLGWGAVLGRPVQLHTLPGNHNEILQPRAANVMAERVRGALSVKREG